eukprot:6032245-Prymnesium_polylepis.1
MQGAQTAAQARPRREPKGVDRFKPPEAAESAKAPVPKRRKQKQHQPSAQTPVSTIFPEVQQDALTLFLRGKWSTEWRAQAASGDSPSQSSVLAALEQSWFNMPDEMRSHYHGGAQARNHVLREEPDLLMSVFLQIPALTFTQEESWSWRCGSSPAKVYASCAQVSKHWNTVLLGKTLALEQNAQLLLGNVLTLLDTPGWMVGDGSPPHRIGGKGWLARPRFCKVMALSTKRANAVAAVLPSAE